MKFVVLKGTTDVHSAVMKDNHVIFQRAEKNTDGDPSVPSDLKGLVKVH